MTRVARTARNDALQPPITYVDRSEVREGRIEELERAVLDLVRHVSAHRGRVASYGVFLDADRTTMTVVHVHPDSDSLAALMEAVAPVLPPFRDLLRLEAIDVYGEPGKVVRDQLRRKVDLLGGTVTVHEHIGGVGRSPET